MSVYLHLSMAFQAATACAGGWAAYQWYRSTLIEIPDDVRVDGYVYEGGYPDLNVYGVAEMGAAIYEQGMANRRAAIWTAVSVGAQALAAGLTVFGL
jgi:hypothetical protein